MTRDIVKVRPVTSISDIALLMSQHRISGVRNLADNWDVY
jgi:CBS domain-containing protein